jgi:hypothetical protein
MRKVTYYNGLDMYEFVVRKVNTQVTPSVFGKDTCWKAVAWQYQGVGRRLHLYTLQLIIYGSLQYKLQILPRQKVSDDSNTGFSKK